MFDNLTVKEKVWLSLREIVKQRVSKYTESGVAIICNKYSYATQKEELMNVNADMLSSNNAFFPLVLQMAVDSYNFAYNKHGRDKLMLKYVVDAESTLLVNAHFMEEKDEVSSDEAINLLPFLDEAVDKMMSKYLLKDIQKVDITKAVRDFQAKLDYGRYFFVFTSTGELTNNPFTSKTMEVQNTVENDSVYRVVNMLMNDKDKQISPDGMRVDIGEKETVMVFKSFNERLKKQQEAERAALALVEKEGKTE